MIGKRRQRWYGDFRRMSEDRWLNQWIVSLIESEKEVDSDAGGWNGSRARWQAEVYNRRGC